MEREYTQTKDHSKLMAWEYVLAQSKFRKKFIKYLKPISFLGAVIYCTFTPAESTSNGECNFVLSILLTILVQIPLCTLILYLILKLVAYAPQSAINKEIEKMPDGHWGSRTFKIAPDGVKLIAPQCELKVSLERINSITETENSIALNDRESPVFLLPKSEFELSEIAEAFDRMKSEPVYADKPFSPHEKSKNQSSD